MIIELPTLPPSANVKPSQEFLDYFKYFFFQAGTYSVEIVVYTMFRRGDIDNRIKHVMNALEDRGLKQVVEISAFYKLAFRERTVINIESRS